METLRSIYDHREQIAATFAAFLFAWTPVATLLARFVARPPASASWLKRGLYDLFVDTPAWAAALGRSGIFGGAFNVPGLPSRLAVDNPSPALSKLMATREPMPPLPPSPSPLPDDPNMRERAPTKDVES
jgi:hypothetical protein